MKHMSAGRLSLALCIPNFWTALVSMQEQFSPEVSGLFGASALLLDSEWCRRRPWWTKRRQTRSLPGTTATEALLVVAKGYQAQGVPPGEPYTRAADEHPTWYDQYLRTSRGR
jgi:hypothetical protein